MASPSCLKLKSATLKPSQIEIAQYVRNPKRRGLLVFHETGSGKTLAGIATINCFLRDNPSSTAFFVTPTSVADQVKGEIKKAGLDMKRITVLPHVTFLKRFVERKISVKDSMIVLDEAHLFANLPKVKDMAKKSSEKARSVQLLKACQQAKKVILMTATPSVNLAKQMYAYLSYIEGRRIASKDGVQRIHTDAKCYVSFFKRTANDPNYPSKEIHIHRFVMSSKYLKVYNRIEVQQKQELMARGFNPNKNQKAFLTAVRRASNKIPGEENPKALWLVEQLKKRLRPSVVYSSWKSSGIRYIQEYLKKAGIKFEEISGSVSKGKRLALKEQFNTGKLPVLFITAAGAEGLDLKGVRDIYILEPYWSHSRYQQVIGRGVRYQSHLHLPASERKVDIHYLVLQKPDAKDDVKIDNIKTDPLSADDRVMVMCYQKGRNIQDLYGLFEKEDFRSPECKK